MDDLISRQAAIDACKHHKTEGLVCKNAAIAMCVDSIKALPSAQPEPIAIRVDHELSKEEYERLKRDMQEQLVILLPKESTQQWIPCSERLPEDYTDVLAWFEYFRYGDYNRMYQTHGIGNYVAKYDSWTINHETGWRKLRVIAWMPLPEPYEEGKS